jgi:hypothetical protein
VRHAGTVHGKRGPAVCRHKDPPHHKGPQGPPPLDQKRDAAKNGRPGTWQGGRRRSCPHRDPALTHRKLGDDGSARRLRGALPLPGAALPGEPGARLPRNARSGARSGVIPPPVVGSKRASLNGETRLLERRSRQVQNSVLLANARRRRGPSPRRRSSRRAGRSRESAAGGGAGARGAGAGDADGCGGWRGAQGAAVGAQLARRARRPVALLAASAAQAGWRPPPRLTINTTSTRCRTQRCKTVVARRPTERAWWLSFQNESRKHC